MSVCYVVGIVFSELLEIDNTIYVYSGVALDNIPSLMYTLDISIPWRTANPAWMNHTSDEGIFPGPAIEYSSYFPPTKQVLLHLGRSQIIESSSAQYMPATQQLTLPAAIASMQTQQIYGQRAVTGPAQRASKYGVVLRAVWAIRAHWQRQRPCRRLVQWRHFRDRRPCYRGWWHVVSCPCASNSRSWTCLLEVARYRSVDARGTYLITTDGPTDWR